MSRFVGLDGQVWQDAFELESPLGVSWEPYRLKECVLRAHFILLLVFLNIIVTSCEFAGLRLAPNIL